MLDLCLFRSLPAAVVVLTLAAACSGDEDTDDPRPKTRFDAQVVVDTGPFVPPTPIDAGFMADDCTSNPNGCAPFEIRSAPPACSCTGICEAGYVYDAVTRTCDPVGVPDSGVPDSGAPPDSGEIPDSGAPGTCTTAADCPGGAAARCLDSASFDICSGGDCFCVLACDWRVPVGQSGCAAGEACTYFDLPAVEAVCLADQGGGRQAQPCTTTYVNGMRDSDTCNGSQNYICLDSGEQNPTGLCSRLCDAASDGVCASLGAYTCVGIDPASSTLGICLGTPPGYTDLGRSCPPAACQGGVCAVELGGICSASCAGLSQCPTGAICVGAPQAGPICAVECVPGAAGDAACRAIDPALACGELTSGTGICFRP